MNPVRVRLAFSLLFSFSCIELYESFGNLHTHHLLVWIFFLKMTRAICSIPMAKNEKGFLILNRGSIWVLILITHHHSQVQVDTYTLIHLVFVCCLVQTVRRKAYAITKVRLDCLILCAERTSRITITTLVDCPEGFSTIHITESAIVGFTR